MQQSLGKEQTTTTTFSRKADLRTDYFRHRNAEKYSCLPLPIFLNTRHAKTPQHYAENILNREFHAEKPNEKWLTDVTEFKYYEGPRVKKVYQIGRASCRERV